MANHTDNPDINELLAQYHAMNEQSTKKVDCTEKSEDGLEDWANEILLAQPTAQPPMLDELAQQAEASELEPEERAAEPTVQLPMLDELAQQAEASELALDSKEQEESTFANNIEFDTKFRGYDKEQVDHYIDAISLDYNKICKQCAALQTENEGLRRALSRLIGETPQPTAYDFAQRLEPIWQTEWEQPQEEPEPNPTIESESAVLL